MPPKTNKYLSDRLQRELTRRIGGNIKVQVVMQPNELADVYIQTTFTNKFTIDRNIEFTKTTDGLAKGMMNYLVERIKQSAMAVQNMYQIRSGTMHGVPHEEN